MAISQKTALSAATTFLARVIPRRCSIIILSDLISPPFIHSLTILKRRHEIITIRITDPHECQPPDAGFIEIEDPETGEQLLIDTSDEEFRQRYRVRVKESGRWLESDFAKTRIDNVQLATDEPYDHVLNRFFADISRRRAYGRILHIQVLGNSGNP